jgi:hypothetical protein
MRRKRNMKSMSVMKDTILFKEAKERETLCLLGSTRWRINNSGQSYFLRC